MMKWIDVKDELPKFNEKVFTYSEGSGRMYICFRRKEEEYNEHWSICEDQDCSCVGCTAPIDYWMPLPNQPERSKREDYDLVYKDSETGKTIPVYGLFDPRRCGALNNVETR